MNRATLAGLLLLIPVCTYLILDALPIDFGIAETETLLVKQSGGVSERYYAPLRPMREHPFGTDEWGRDIFVKLLSGAKYTFGYLVFGLATEAAVGGAVVIWRIRFRKGSRARERHHHFSLVGAIPKYLFVYFSVYQITINSPIRPARLGLLQTLAIVIVFLPGFAGSALASVSRVLDRDFITYSRMLTRSGWHVAFKHVLPNSREQLTILLLQEGINYLVVFGILGYFNVFVGGTVFTPDPATYTPVLYEWSGFLGKYHHFVRTSSYWVTVIPLLHYLSLLSGLVLLSIGIERTARSRYRA